MKDRGAPVLSRRGEGRERKSRCLGSLRAPASSSTSLATASLSLSLSLSSNATASRTAAASPPILLKSGCLGRCRRTRNEQWITGAPGYRVILSNWEQARGLPTQHEDTRLVLLADLNRCQPIRGETSFDHLTLFITPVARATTTTTTTTTDN